MRLVSSIQNINGSTLIKLLALLLILSFVSHSILMNRICSGLVFLTCVVLGLREKSYLNPYLLFSLTPLSLACYVSVSEELMPDLSEKTWLLCNLNNFAFVFSLYITKPFKKIKNCIGVNKNIALKKHAIILFVLSLLASIITPLESVLWLFRIAAEACAIKTKEKKMLILVILFMGFNFIGGQMSKMGVLLDVLTVGICYIKYYGISKKQYFKLILGGLLGILIMLYSFTYATRGEGKRDADDTLANYSSRVEWNYSAALFLPYMYLETPWVNVDYVMQTQDSRTYGLWFIKPFLGYVGLKDRYEREYHLESLSSFNVFTYITVGFKDFGFWLSILSPLFLGFFVKKVYTRFLISKSPFDVACYVAIAVATFEMFFSNHFFMISYPFTIVILMEIYKRVVIHMKDNNLELDYRE